MSRRFDRFEIVYEDNYEDDMPPTETSYWWAIKAYSDGELEWISEKFDSIENLLVRFNERVFETLGHVNLKNTKDWSVGSEDTNYRFSNYENDYWTRGLN